MLVLIITFSLAVTLTLLIRSIANKKKLLDHPNERSSHSIPTPKGGGLAILLSFYIVTTYLYLQSQIDTKLFFALLSALPVAVISFIDDIHPLPAKVRFGVQLFSAFLALYLLGGIETLNFSLFSLSGSWLNLIALIGIIWMTNLYNFLDGIDGYAATQALFVSFAIFLLFGNTITLILALSVSGFLVFNWHKASIFMGDVGSAPLGFIFAILMLYDASSPNFLVWIILLSLFWFDATYTLTRRALNREQLSQAHKKHLYQRLNQAGFSHDKVVLMALVFNLTLLMMLYVLPESLYFYLFLLLLVLLYTFTKVIDKLKAFS